MNFVICIGIKDFVVEKFGVEKSVTPETMSAHNAKVPLNIEQTLFYFHIIRDAL